MTTELKDIMAPVIVVFKQRAANLVKIGEKGSALFCVKNAELENAFKVTEYKSAVFEIEDKTLETQIKQIFKGGVKEVLVLEYKTTFASVAEQAKLLKWNWIFSTDTASQETVAAYCIENEKFGLVYNQQSDSKFVVSLNNPSAVLAGGTQISGTALLPVVGGVIAGCPYDKSISYKVFTEFKSVELPTLIAEGQVTLYNEEEGVRVASPVNTLLTLGDNVTEDMKSISIVEGMQRLKEDAIFAFRTSYKGKYKNSYDNQCLFISAFNYYLEQLEEIGILDNSYSNRVNIDVEKQRQMWIATGKSEASEWDELTVKNNSYKNMFFPRIDAKFLDAIEGMQMTVEMF